jgi:hypothetical protein
LTAAAEEVEASSETIANGTLDDIAGVNRRNLCRQKCAGLDAEEGRSVRAARLLGAEQAWRASTGNRRPAWRDEEYERALAAARAGLSAQSFTAARAAGRAMTLDQAVADALDETSAKPAVGVSAWGQRPE